ncbi:hypothetical protein C8P68_1096 [Mucilaginibacter yixingensis]|uniref:Uncharacterized protein n=1 Tax=Mucilaginibacter yixingensis TaxID=1295612 RepID=A0A2T5J580_9SPHI|nr:hypothetical protein [Mucilaginibacter yixingensis]PTQ93134.1 hypothetical protein C8P68_1096 [Mucilaginibacter yixingensis]
MKAFLFRGRFVFIPLAVAAFLSLISFVVMQLWNCLLPGILHVSAITFWQAMGIFILCKILFGFGKGGPRFGGGRAPWMRQRMREHFEKMTPEERERFKEKFAGRCGGPFGRGRFDNDWMDYKEGTEEK